MKALVYHEYGQPDQLKMEEVPKPRPKDNEVLVKVHAVSLNASDWEFLTGSPAYVRAWGLFKPGNKILGTDIAGQVEAVGSKIKQFKPGDEVFGDIMGHGGGLAEYTCVPEKTLVLKPAKMTFEEAAAIPQAGVVALQGIRAIQEGQKVLINGAGGGSGSFAIQLAKMFGAEVTGVDNDGKLELMRTLGADHVIDYKKEDYTKTGKQYDLILDLVAHRSIFDSRRALNPGGEYRLVGGYIQQLLQAALLGPIISKLGRKKMGLLAVRPNQEDLDYLKFLILEGKIKPAIDKCYSFERAAEAFQRLGEGKALGKMVIII